MDHQLTRAALAALAAASAACGASPPATCVPATSDGELCAQRNANCGELTADDGCGPRTIACGNCLSTEVCGLATPNACAACVPQVTPRGIAARDARGRLRNARGIDLVDWDGFVANRAPTITLAPPPDIGFPATATITGDHPRMYFDLPSTVGATGPSKTITFATAASTVDVRLGVFPDRDGDDEQHALTLRLDGAADRTETIAVIVHDQDRAQAPAAPIVVDFGQDRTGFFGDAGHRAVIQAAADDWAYFIADPPFDPVAAAAESTWIWNQDGFVSGAVVTNAASYRGFLLYAYGIHAAALRSGGEGSLQGGFEHQGGVELPLRRSGGLEVETAGNYNQLGWYVSLDDDGWWTSGNLGNEPNDLYSIVHHEIGHAHGFDASYPRFAAALGPGLGSPAIVAYLGHPIAIDGAAHFNGTVDPDSGFGVFGNEYNGPMPRRRWIITRLDLLALEALGYTLRPIAFDDWPDDGPPDCP